MRQANRNSLALVEEALTFAEELGVTPSDVPGGKLLDFGGDALGGIEAGLLFCEIQTAGQSTVQSSVNHIGAHPWHHIEVMSDHPRSLAFGTGFLGAAVDVQTDGENETVRLSGPILEHPNISDSENGHVPDEDMVAVCAHLPDGLPLDVAGGEVVSHVREATGADEIIVVAAESSTTVGLTATAGQTGGLVVHQLLRKGGLMNEVLSVASRTPIPPATDATHGHLDAITHGGRVHLNVRRDRPEVFESLTTARDPESDTDWDSVIGTNSETTHVLPATVTVSVEGGPTYAVGDPADESLLKRWDVNRL